MKRCTLEDVRIGAKRPYSWRLDGCDRLLLSVGGTIGSPWGAKDGLNSQDGISLAAALANATSLRSLTMPGLNGIFHMHNQPGIGPAAMRAIAGALCVSCRATIATHHCIPSPQSR